MSERKVEEAVNYAASTNKIEDMHLTKNELKEVKNAILEQKDSEKFLTDLTKKKNVNDKNRPSTKL